MLRVTPNAAQRILGLMPVYMAAARHERERAAADEAARAAIVNQAGEAPLVLAPGFTANDYTVEELAFVAKLMRSAVAEFIPHSPSPRQAAFLMLETREAGYGGAAGGGKSDALFMAALMYVDVPGYAALILRRTYADLSKPGGLMARAQEWLAGTRARWNGETKTWTFPSGATITFGYLAIERDKRNYQGSELQFVAYDELTQFMETQYTYLFSRLRRLKNSRVPLRMRSGTNPGGPGHIWVKKRFDIRDGVGNDERRPFVVAKLSDNRAIDQDEYRESLAELDYVTRQQLEDGDWDVELTTLFPRQWWRRYRELPAEAKVAGAGGIFVDTAHEEKTSADYSVLATVRQTDAAFYWTRLHRERMEYPALERAVLDAHERDPDLPIYVEDTVGAKALIQRMKTMIPGVIAWKIEGRSKYARAQATSPIVESGACYLPEEPLECDWVPDFIDEHAVFSAEEHGHDDQVDTTTMALLRLWGGRGSTAALREAIEEAEAAPVSRLERQARDDAGTERSIFDRQF